MRDDGRQSDNVEDRRGESGRRGLGGRGGLGIGTVVIALAAWYFGIDPNIVLQGLDQASQQSVDNSPAEAPPANDEQARFVSMVLADTEDTWRAIFSAAGKQYSDPKLVLFSGSYPTACGMGEAAMGPFYCPADHKVYIDLAFYDELKTRFKAPGDFAQAYVIAHEVGHHVQNLVGISEKIQSARQRANAAQSNALSVRLELQADCFAGLWAITPIARDMYWSKAMSKKRWAQQPRLATIPYKNKRAVMQFLSRLRTVRLNNACDGFVAVWSPAQ